MFDSQLEFVSVPEGFCRLLKANIQAGDKNFQSLASSLNKSESLLGILERSFKDVDLQGRPEVIIKSLGWYGLRNKLASLYIDYKLNNEFPKNINSDLCKDLLILENEVKLFTVEGSSRFFLFMFYLKLHKFQTAPILSKEFDLSFYIEIFKKKRVKSLKIDWLVFVLGHFSKFLGEERTQQLLEGKVDYSDLYRMLDKSQKDFFITNALAYGTSINETDFFHQLRI